MSIGCLLIQYYIAYAILKGGSLDIYLEGDAIKPAFALGSISPLPKDDRIVTEYSVTLLVFLPAGAGNERLNEGLNERCRRIRA
jgi:hypothetical protein